MAPITTRSAFACAVLLLAVAACGDDDDTSAGSDAGPEPTAIAYALGTNYMTAGVLSSVAVPSLEVTTDLAAEAISNDPVLRAAGGRLYVVNRFGADNITVIDLATNQLIDQYPTGAGSNPQDVAVKGDMLYVPTLGLGAVLAIDTRDPEAEPLSIDLSSYDEDGNPDPGSVALVGDELYVTLSLLDAQFASRGGKVVVIDANTNTVRTAFDLQRANPVTLLQPVPVGPFAGALAVGTSDFAGTGCIELITAGDEPSSTCLIDEARLGGYPSRLAFAADALWVAASASFTETKLVAVTAAGALGGSLGDAGIRPTDFAVCPTGHIVVADATAGGVRVYDASGQQLTSGPLDLGLPPVFANGLVCP